MSDHPVCNQCQEKIWRKEYEVKDRTPPSLDDMIREFERVNFYHANDSIQRDGHSWMTDAYCIEAAERLAELKSLRAENEKLRAENAQLRKNVQTWMEACFEQKDKKIKYREALEFYADNSNWVSNSGKIGVHGVWLDQGHKAKSALQAAGEKEE